VDLFCERAAGEFTRTVRLPEGIHTEAIRECAGREASRDYGVTWILMGRADGIEPGKEG
jgi:hypothetical protein